MRCERVPFPEEYVKVRALQAADGYVRQLELLQLPHDWEGEREEGGEKDVRERRGKRATKGKPTRKERDRTGTK